MDDLTKLTDKEKRHKKIKFAKPALQLIPVIGGAASELLDQLITDPAQERRDKFMMDLSNRIDELMKRIALMLITLSRRKT